MENRHSFFSLIPYPVFFLLFARDWVIMDGCRESKVREALSGLMEPPCWRACGRASVPWPGR